MEKFIVTLNCHAHYGYVEYDPATKTAKVCLDVPEAKARVEEFLQKPLTLDLARVEEFLQKPLTLDLPEGDTIRQFVTKTLMPLDSLENFKVCLGRLWVNTDVRVEWSMPPGAMDEL